LDNKIYRHFPWLFWIGCIAILSLLPGDQLPDYKLDWISIDTLTHICMYLGFSFLLLIGFYPRNFKTKNKLNLLILQLYLKVILAGILVGYIIELVQGKFIYRRYFDYIDVVANGFGTIFGVIAFTLIGIKILKINTNAN